MKLKKQLNLVVIYYALTLPCNEAFATALNIDNSNFDYQEIVDESTLSNIIGWRIEQGLAGLYNPPEAVFIGEINNGKHKNTLYLIDNAKVSQTLRSTVIPNADYTIKFDVGQRADVDLSSYTITVKTENNLLLKSSNPTFPASPGEFTRGEITFNSGNISTGLIKIEFESHSLGHVHFDNVELSYTQNRGVLGEWRHTQLEDNFRVDVDYLAETDGFVVQYTSNTCSGNSENLVLTNPDGSKLYVARAIDYDSMMAPVKKGQKWRIERYRSGPNCTSNIGFISLN